MFPSSNVGRRIYSLVYGIRAFPSRAKVVRQLFGNAKERQEKKDEILAELRKGYLSDLKEVKSTGGKRYLALNKPFPKEESLSLPVIKGVTVTGRPIKLPQDITGNSALLLMWTRKHGQQACDIYRSSFSEKFAANGNTQVFEVNLIDSWIFRMMRSLINKNLQKQIPKDRQANFVCCYEGTSEIVKTIFENALVGHAFLVDHAGFIRWKAHGIPTNDELSYLANCTNMLSSEINT